MAEKYVPDIISDAEAFELSNKQRRSELFGVRVPRHEWIGPGAEDEFCNGKGADDDGQ